MSGSQCTGLALSLPHSAERTFTQQIIYCLFHISCHLAGFQDEVGLASCYWRDMFSTFPVTDSSQFPRFDVSCLVTDKTLNCSHF
ncbi:hypothetical protein Y032_0896g2925 [Ancylostoma ceylanicum]|uniref:Uncharacterized protein n=1 Tax=Ancylostoma ceylanicum TaxID=53326 RepID=A0A016W9C6_9BILA|nr:hypothetical protein Y032_0896g2925 [Ancylostoma ceylanicum]